MLGFQVRKPAASWIIQRQFWLNTTLSGFTVYTHTHTYTHIYEHPLLPPTPTISSCSEVPFEERWASLVAQTVKHLPVMQETWVWSLGRKDPLEKEMATHSSTLAWKIPWMEEPGRLQSIGLQRVGRDWAVSLVQWGRERSLKMREKSLSVNLYLEIQNISQRKLSSN